jgi:L-ascorbate metabolism protein UlaG (beta-lactamase superfamily)
MKVTYLGHDGFLVETKKAYYLFDYIRGELPVWEEGKPLYIFSTHSHEDHFCEEIFAPQTEAAVTAYILSYDIGKKYKNRKPEWLQRNQERIFFAKPGEPLKFPDFSVESLKSTDLGVAFLVQEDVVIYHAGDLNWWHWEGEPKAWNRNMEVDYKREIDKLENRQIDLAFVPLDPRLESAYSYGLDYFLEKTETKVVFPMHFWGDTDVIKRYKKDYRGSTEVMEIEKEGEMIVLKK